MPKQKIGKSRVPGVRRGSQPQPERPAVKGVKAAKAASDLAAAVRASVAAKQLPGGKRPFCSELDYTADQLEFLRAIEAYKQLTGRKFPTWCEVLAVLVGLGYAKCSGTTSPSESSEPSGS